MAPSNENTVDVIVIDQGYPMLGLATVATLETIIDYNRAAARRGDGLFFINYPLGCGPTARRGVRQARRRELRNLCRQDQLLAGLR